MLGFWIFLGMVLNIIGVVGAVVPGIPWPQISYLTLILAQLCLHAPFSWNFIILWGIISVALLVVDYVLPIRGAKKFWWSKWGNVGCLIGILVGLFMGPVGILIGPFAGAFVGEYLYQGNGQQSLKAALGAFVGFMSGIILKLIISIVLFGYFLAAVIQHFL